MSIPQCCKADLEKPVLFEVVPFKAKGVVLIY